MPTDEGYRFYVDSLMGRAALARRRAGRDRERAALGRRLGRADDGACLAPAVAPEPARGLRARPRHRPHQLPAHRPRAPRPPAHPGGDGLLDRARHPQGDRVRGARAAGGAAGLRQLPEPELRGHEPRRHPPPPARADERGEGALRLAAAEGRGPRRPRFRGRRRRGERLPRRDVEHPRAPRVRGRGADARALQDLRGEEPARPPPERLPVGRRHPRPDRPREPDPTCATSRSSPPAARSRATEGFGLGVLGSTRMEYAHVVALVDHVARAVSDVLRRHRE